MMSAFVVLRTALIFVKLVVDLGEQRAAKYPASGVSIPSGKLSLSRGYHSPGEKLSLSTGYPSLREELLLSSGYHSL